MKYLFFAVLFCCSVALAQTPTPSPAPATIAEKTKNFTRYNGYFTFWWDAPAGKIWILVDKFNQEFLYVNSLPTGLGSNDIGLDRGQIGNSRIVYFNRVGNKLLLIQPNYDFRASSGNIKERNAVQESFAQSAIAGFEIAVDEGDKVLIDATPFFLRDAQGAADRIRNMHQGSYSINENRSAIYLTNTKNFPFNSEFEATITFTGGSDAGDFVRSVTPSPEAITVRMHHSFVQLPDSNYKPRRYDVRCGYFGISYMDYSSPFTEQIQQMFITRHRLSKKNPEDTLSEPVKPIRYYLDNGTPEPIRTALLTGARWWNQAFESAGYKNAFIVDMLPDSVDPMDIRYNVINWVHRSTRGWSYGASIIDPRTGEIIKGNVTLGSLRVRQDYLIFTGLLSPFETGKPVPETMRQYALKRLSQLAAHEVGHTLGLQHNFASSYNDRASVMDYPYPQLSLNKNGEIDFTKSYTEEIGPWDKRCIEYGYSDFGNEKDENKRLQQILETNSRHGYLFITDVDARASGGLHPYAHLWDNGKDPADELKNVLRIRDRALAHFSLDDIPVNTPVSKLEDVLVPIYNFHRYQLEAVCKLIGGMDYSYSVKGDPNQVKPNILPQAVQLKALNAALGCLDPGTLTLSENIIRLIPPRPPMYENTGELFESRMGINFDALSAAEALANYELEFLFDSERANRLVQFKAEAGTIGWDDVLDAIIEKTWKIPAETGMKQAIVLQTQQMVVSRIIDLGQNDNANYLVKSICYDRLQSLKTYCASQMKLHPSLKAQYAYTIDRINKPKDFTLPKPAYIAPGAPIGSDF